MSARETALRALLACEKQGAWSDGVLRNLIRSAGLDRRDAALATRICFGVQQNLLLLDFWIDALSSVPAKKLEPVVRGCIRMGMYQIRFLDRIPESAAVNESVALTKSCGNRKASGLVNGVLRSFIRQKDSLPEPEGENRLSVLYSHPKPLVDLLAAEAGEEIEDLLRADNEEPPTCIQVNTLRTDADSLERELIEAGTEIERHPWLPDCFLVTRTGSLEQLPAFAEGRFAVQDAAARLAVTALAPKTGERILDACGAPGGKSFAAAMEMNDTGEIITCDLHPHKIKLIEQGAARLGITSVAAQVQDGKSFRPEWENSFDRVLVDAPCSGLGVIRKKPDIRYKNLSQIADLPRIQGEILANAARYVKSGGTLVYSTCTVLQRENGDVVNAFLKAHPDFALEPFSAYGILPDADGTLTLWPHRHGTDGFFIAVLRKE